MSQQVNYADIKPGMQVFDAMGAALGPVEAVNANTLRVQGQDVPVESIARTDATGVHLHLASNTDEAARPADAMASNTGEYAQPNDALAEEGQLVIPLAEERLTIDTRQVDLGEVIIRKRVIEEERMVPIIVRREEVEVFRREPGQPWSPEAMAAEGAEVTRIPLNAWEQVVTKRAFVTREVVLEKGSASEEQQVAGTVRREHLSVDERYADARPELEQHFRAGAAGATGAQTFADAEPHYRAGFASGADPQYHGRDFADVEPQLREHYSVGEHQGDAWAQLRDQIQAGFQAARRRS